MNPRKRIGEAEPINRRTHAQLDHALNAPPPRGAARLTLWAWGLGQWLRLGRPQAFIHFVAGVGDELLCSCLAHELHRRGVDPVWILTLQPELFDHNPDSLRVLPFNRRFLALARRLGGREIQPRYTGRIAPDVDASPPRHVLRIMLAAAGVRGPATLRPYLYLSDAERSDAAWASDAVVVQSSGQGAIYPNRLKEYPRDRLQAVVSELARSRRIIQVGHPADVLLEGAVDLRGKTSIRQTAAVLSQARLFVGAEGGLMHVARAVECPAVIIYGGRLWPEQTGYICNANLVNRPPCSPCWQWNRCDFGHVCMLAIEVADVVNAVNDMLSRPRGPLATETADIGDADAWLPPTAQSIA